MQAPRKPIKPRNAVAAAILGLWLLASLGVFIVLRMDHWTLRPSQETGSIRAQLGAFYMAFFAAHLPGVAAAAYIITRARFRHPPLVAALTTSLYLIVMFALRLIRWPWGRFDGGETWMPIVFEVSGIAALTVLAAGFAWMISRRGSTSFPTRF